MNVYCYPSDFNVGYLGEKICASFNDHDSKVMLGSSSGMSICCKYYRAVEHGFK